MKTDIIHYYPSENAYSKSVCGIPYDKIEEHTNDIEWISCKKCLKKINKELK